jgi:predicted PurR-regulated permease PerM
MPDWWLSSSGLFFVLGSILMVVLIAISLYLIKILADISRQLHALTNRVDGIAKRVDNIAETVQNITQEVGVRTTGIVRYVDQIAGGTFDFLEKFAPLFMAFGAVWKLGVMIKRGKAKR